MHESGKLAAVGAADGSTAILQLCDGLVELQPNEKATFGAVRHGHALHSCLSYSALTGMLLALLSCPVHVYS